MYFGDTIEGLFFAAAAIFLILVAPGLAIAAFRATRRLRDEIDLLRAEMRALRDSVAARPRPESVVPSAAPPAGPAQPVPPTQPIASEPSAELTDLVTGPALQSSTPAPAIPAMQAPPPRAAVRDDASRWPQGQAVQREATPRGFEQRLGARGFVWLGAACIALAGAFLVKYSIDEGLLGPATRVTLGVILGILLLVAGDYMRRRSVTIGQALTAAGIADLFASLFAAFALYHLLPAAFAFVLLAGVTFLGIALSLRHGPFVGLVGLAGGFITPAIVSTGEPNPGVLFTYLYFLQLGALWLERQRGWWYLPAIANAGGLCWAFLVLALPTELDGSRVGEIWVPCYLILVAAGALWLTPRSAKMQATDSGAWPPPQIVALATVLAAGILMLLWLAAGEFGGVDWLFVLMLAVVGMATGRLRADEELPALFLAALPVLGLLAWNLNDVGSFDLTQMSPLSERYLWIACLVGALGLFGGFGLAWGATRPERWSLLSATAGGAALAMAYWRLQGVDLLLPWSIICLILSAIHLGLAERLQRWRDRGYRRSFGVHVLACAGFIAAAVPMWVEREWLAVLWSLLLPVTAWVANKIEEPWLRKGLWIGAPAVLLAVLLSGFPAGDRPIFNWLAYGLGVPTLCFAATAWLARRASDLRLMLLLQAGALLLGFLLVTLEVRHLFHGRDFKVAPFGFAECGTLALLWGAMALATWRLAERRGEARIRWLAYGLGALAALITLGWLWVIVNPLLNYVEIAGPPILNTLLYVYGGGFALFLVLARVVHRSRLDLPRRDLVVMLAIAVALVDGFLGISALNRHLFQGKVISFSLFGGSMSDAELYGYSVAWLAYGGLTLALALWRRLPPLRHAGAGIVLLVVLKVFVVDADGLTGLYRVASFLGLGLTLLGLGWLYQRYVLRWPAK